MHSPLSVHAAAQAREASGPSPVRTMSRTPAMTAPGSALAMPAGSTLGQTSTHLPHCVQAASISSMRLSSADSKVVWVIARNSLDWLPRSGNPCIRPAARGDKPCARLGHSRQDTTSDCLPMGLGARERVRATLDRKI
jgi:hypothetical protein